MKRPDELFMDNGRYALRIKGESMINIGLMDGDYVVIQKADTARNGEIVMALVERKEATLKRIYYLPDEKIELRPENNKMKPMVYPKESIRVQGKMVGMFRFSD